MVTMFLDAFEHLRFDRCSIEDDKMVNKGMKEINGKKN